MPSAKRLFLSLVCSWMLAITITPILLPNVASAEIQHEIALDSTAVRACAASPPAFVSKFGSFGTSSGEFYFPQHIALTQSNDLYVSEYGTSTVNRVQKFDYAGSYLSSFGSSGRSNGQLNPGYDDYPLGMAVDSSGNIYMADSGNQRIQKFNPSGSYLFQWKTRGVPTSLAIDAEGNIYSAESSYIRKYTPSGIYLSQFGSPGVGNGQLNYAMDIALSPSGDIYVSDYVNNRIQKFDSSGTYLTGWGSYGDGPSQFVRPEGITMDSLGDIYVSDTGNNRIQKFNSAGAYILQFGSPGDGDGQFNQPAGIAHDANESLYVVDSGNNRVQKFLASDCQPDLPTLTLQVNKSGPGRVDSASGSIGCGENCSEVFIYNNTVTLEAKPDPGSFFLGWSGACSGDTTYCQVTMGESRLVSANFAKLPDPPSLGPNLKDLQIKGKQKVMRRVKATYLVTVKNTGDQAATNIRIEARGKGVQASRAFGTLSAGSSETVDLPLVFKKTGRVQVAFKVSADNAASLLDKKNIRVIG